MAPNAAGRTSRTTTPRVSATQRGYKRVAGMFPNHPPVIVEAGKAASPVSISTLTVLVKFRGPNIALDPMILVPNPGTRKHNTPMTSSAPIAKMAMILSEKALDIGKFREELQKQIEEKQAKLAKIAEARADEKARKKAEKQERDRMEYETNAAL
jgi:hypothetical protein